MYYLCDTLQGNNLLRSEGEKVVLQPELSSEIAFFRELQEYSFLNRPVIVIKHFLETYLRFCLAKSVPEQTY